MKWFSLFLAVVALLSAVLCLCALIGLNPTLPSTWGALALLEQELVGRLNLDMLETFWRALIYMALAGTFAGLSAYVKPRSRPAAPLPRPRPSPGVAAD